MKHGSPTYKAMFKKTIQTQMVNVINNTPKTDISINIEFKTNADAFEAAMKQTFGWFVKEEPKVCGERLAVRMWKWLLVQKRGAS